MRALGLDLGGTNSKACVVEGGAPPRILAEARVETHAERGPGPVLDTLASLGQSLIETAGPVAAVGLGAPGPLDLDRGRSISMPNLPGFEDVPLVAELEQRLELPAALLNDARAVTLAELELGAGLGASELVCFVLGTGVGGGVVVDGKLLLALGGTAGELGHQTIEPDGPPCGCGNAGCLEQYASGPSIARAAGKATAEDVVSAAQAGEDASISALEQAGIALGIGIANVSLVVGPERVVIAGGVAAAGDLLLDPARRELERRNRMQPLERISIVQAELGGSAGAIGAALWASAGATRPPIQSR